jgi:hypothetical protein
MQLSVPAMNDRSRKPMAYLSPEDDSSPDPDERLTPPPAEDPWTGLGEAVREIMEREEAERNRQEGEEWEREHPTGPF